MGCGPSMRAEDQSPVPEPRKDWEKESKADVKVTPSRKNCSPQTEAGGPKDNFHNAENLDQQARIGSLPGTIPESSPTHSERNGRGDSEDSVTNGLITKSQLLENRERPKSSDILEELIVQGIIQRQSKVFRNGDSYDVMVDTTEKPLRKPPARLKKLKIEKEAKDLTIKDIQGKMHTAEERRKKKEEEIRKRLWSDRFLPTTNPSDATDLARAQAPFAEDLWIVRAPASEHYYLQEREMLQRKKSESEVAPLSKNYTNAGWEVVESDVHYNQEDVVF